MKFFPSDNQHNLLIEKKRSLSSLSHVQEFFPCINMLGGYFFKISQPLSTPLKSWNNRSTNPSEQRYDASPGNRSLALSAPATQSNSRACNVPIFPFTIVFFCLNFSVPATFTRTRTRTRTRDHDI